MFNIADVDGNGFLDEEEVKALFMKELDKLYVQGMPHSDLMERAEEMERMREHVFLEMDRNRDRLIRYLFYSLIFYSDLISPYHKFTHEF